MNHRITKEKAFRVVGKSIRVTMQKGEDLQRIPQFWGECMRDGTLEQLRRLSANQNTLGLCMDFNRERGEFSYMIAVESQEAGADGLETKEIPGADWAVFESIGPLPDAIQETWRRVFSEWFPTSGYEHADAPELEVYPPGDVSAEGYRCEVRIPVAQQSQT